MKILYTATMLSHICQFHLPHMKMLQKMGYKIDVAANDNLSVKNGLKLENFDKYFNVCFERSPTSIKNIVAYKQMKKIISQNNYDLIICNTPMGGIVTRLAARDFRKRGMKVIYIAHGFHFYKGSSITSWLVYYPIERLFLRYCDILVTVNNEDYAFAKRKLNKKNKIRHIHGVGVLSSRYFPHSDYEQIQLRKNENISTNDFVILCTGEINKNKNQIVLLKAISELKCEINNLKVLIAGNGPLEEEINTYIIDNGLKDIVFLLGYRTDLENVVPFVDIVVSCSFREGMPLNIIEAMLCEKIIIASINRGHKELIEHNVDGYLFIPDNYLDLSKLIGKVYFEKDNSKIIAKHAFEKGKLYSVETVQKEIFKIIDETINNT